MDSDVEPYLDDDVDDDVPIKDYASFEIEIAVKDDDPTRRGKFNRVLPVDYESGYVMFPSTDAAPIKESPSWILKQPQGSFSLYYAIRSCMRVQTLRVQTLRVQTRRLGGGTIFTLSPTIALTCAHVATENTRFRCMEGGLIHFEAFDLKTKPRYHLQLMYRNDGGDIAFLKIVLDVTYPHPPSPATYSLFEEYLLPCSPEETSGVVAVVSFPGVTSFMLKAHEELIDDFEDHGIWKRYKPCMKEELRAAKSSEQLSNPNFTRSKVVYRATKLTKRYLFKLLQETFSCHVCGCMAVSPGKISNSTTTCSTLAGSSGGPICLPEKPGYACGMHQAGSFSENECIVFDHVQFVKPYLEYVLPELPGPRDERWKDRDLLPFLKWLQKHSGQYKELLINDRQKEWVEAAFKVTTSPPQVAISELGSRKRRNKRAVGRLLQKQKKSHKSAD